MPPTSKTVRARSAATVNTADFSPGLYRKLPRTLWEESGRGPKREQVSSISPLRTSMRIGCLPEMCPSTCGPKITGFRFPLIPFCLGSKRQTRSSEPVTGDSVNLGPVWQHVHFHLSEGHHPSAAPSSGSIHLPQKAARLVLRCQNYTCKFKWNIPGFC